MGIAKLLPQSRTNSHPCQWCLSAPDSSLSAAPSGKDVHHLLGDLDSAPPLDTKGLDLLSPNLLVMHFKEASLGEGPASTPVASFLL